jgi:hypothetical protein
MWFAAKTPALFVRSSDRCRISIVNGCRERATLPSRRSDRPSTSECFKPVITVREVFKDDGSSALFALFALERSMPLTADQTAALSLLAVFAACAQAEADGAPLDEGFRTLLEDADALYQLAPPSMHLRHLLVAAWERMAGHSCARFTRQIAKMARACDNIVEQTARQGRRRNQELAELAVMPIMRDAEELAEVIDEFRAHVVSTPVVAELDALSASLVDIQRQAANIRRGRY